MKMSLGSILIELQILTDISKTDFLYLTITTNKYSCFNLLSFRPMMLQETKIIALTDFDLHSLYFFTYNVV